MNFYASIFNHRIVKDKMETKKIEMYNGLPKTTFPTEKSRMSDHNVKLSLVSVK